MCKKQTSVSHSSTASEIISLDAGLRMDGSPALDFWDVVIEVLRSSKSTESLTHGAARNCSRHHKSKPKRKGNRDVDQLSHVDHGTTNAHSSQGESQMNICVDNEAVIKMIIEGRSPTMRHVTGTHRVAVDWLSRTPRSKSNMLTPKPTRDEWNHLLLFVKQHELSNVFLQPSWKISFWSDQAMSMGVQESNLKEGSACTWHELVGLTFFGQWNKLARSVTKWTGACDKRSARFDLSVLLNDCLSLLGLWLFSKPMGTTPFSQALCFTIAFWVLVSSRVRYLTPLCIILVCLSHRNNLSNLHLVWYLSGLERWNPPGHSCWGRPGCVRRLEVLSWPFANGVSVTNVGDKTDGNAHRRRRGREVLEDSHASTGFST